MQKTYLYAGCAGVRLANASTMARAGRRARTAAQQKTRRDRPARLGLARPEEPPGQQRQPGQQQHRGDHVELADRRVADRRLRPGRPGRDRRRPPRTAPRGRAGAASAPPARAPRPRPPARPAASSPGGTLCASAQIAATPVPAARRAAATPRRAWPRRFPASFSFSMAPPLMTAPPDGRGLRRLGSLSALGRAGQRHRGAGQAGRSSAGTGDAAACPAPGSSCQQASTMLRSANRIRIGYSVPDFRPVCFASAYPCCHCEGWFLGTARPAPTAFAR